MSTAINKNFFFSSHYINRDHILDAEVEKHINH